MRELHLAECQDESILLKVTQCEGRRGEKSPILAPFFRIGLVCCLLFLLLLFNFDYHLKLMDPSPSTSARNKPFRSDCKHILHNVITFCDKEAEEGNVIVPLSQSTKRASQMTGISVSSVKRIRRDSKGEETPKFVSPKKRTPKRTIENVALDNFDCDVIRRTIHEFYAVHKIVPTIRKVLPVLREKINFTHQRETLRKILHEIGFRFKKSQNKRKQIMERSDIILSRTQFLRNMKRYREENRPIVYLDETWIDSNLTFGKCWQTDETVGVLETGNASRRIIVLCAGGEMGFIPNSNLLYKANSTSGDYHGQMNSKIFEKWAAEKLIPNLPQNSVVVIDNAPYHSVQLNKVPNSSYRKQEIIEWLSSKNIPCSSDLRKIELLNLVKRNRPRSKVYKFDTMLQENGFTALRLPPYHCDINAIEYVWAEIKNYIRNLNVTGDLNLSRLLTFSNEAIESITTEHWRKYCSHAVSLENMYWDRDGVIEDLVDPLQIDVSDSSDSDSDTSSDEY